MPVPHPHPHTTRTQSDKEAAAFDEEIRELTRCMEAEQKLLNQQAKRLERLVVAADCCAEDEEGGDSGAALRLEEEGGPSIEDVVAQLQEVSNQSQRKRRCWLCRRLLCRG